MKVLFYVGVDGTKQSMAKDGAVFGGLVRENIFEGQKNHQPHFFANRS